MAGLAVFARGPFGAEVVVIDQDQGCIVHVHVIRRLEVGAAAELEGDALGVLARLGLQAWLIAKNTIVGKDQIVAIR